MMDPIKIKIEEEEQRLDEMKQYYVNVEKNEYKFPTLLDLYGQIPIKKCIFYANKKDEVNFLEKSFGWNNFEVAIFKQVLEQSRLEEEINKFKHGVKKQR